MYDFSSFSTDFNYLFFLNYVKAVNKLLSTVNKCAITIMIVIIINVKI